MSVLWGWSCSFYSCGIAIAFQSPRTGFARVSFGQNEFSRCARLFISTSYQSVYHKSSVIESASLNLRLVWSLIYMQTCDLYRILGYIVSVHRMVMKNRPVDPGSIQGSHRPISLIRIKHRTRANDNSCKYLMHHAACKVEFQTFTRSYSQLTFFNFL